MPSGYAPYDFVPTAAPCLCVPTVDGNDEAQLAPYGRFASGAADVRVDGEAVQGCFTVYSRGDKIHALNEAVGAAEYTTALQLPSGLLVTREMNRHPDGEQHFDSHGHPFCLLLAPPSDTLRLEDVRLVKFDGSRPVNIHRNVWHQPPYLASTEHGRVEFTTAQAKSHVCVDHDFLEQHGPLVAFQP